MRRIVLLCIFLVWLAGCARLPSKPLPEPPVVVIPTFTWSAVVLTSDWYTVPGLQCNMKVDDIDNLFPCWYDGASISVILPVTADTRAAYLMLRGYNYLPSVTRVHLNQNHPFGESVYLWRVDNAD